MKLRSGIKEKTFQLDIKREWKSEKKKQPNKKQRKKCG